MEPPLRDWCTIWEILDPPLRSKDDLKMPPSVADSGFPRPGHQPPRRGRQPIIWPNFSRKLHENERNWTGINLDLRD